MFALLKVQRAGALLQGEPAVHALLAIDSGALCSCVGGLDSQPEDMHQNVHQDGCFRKQGRRQALVGPTNLTWGKLASTLLKGEGEMGAPPAS